MTKNSEIAQIFYDMADILEMQGIAWKPRAYRQAAQAIDSLKENIEDIYAKGGIKAIENIPNIGEALAKKIEEFIKTNKIQAYEKLLNEIPKHMRELMKIPGLGAKRINKLHEILGISTINQLEKAAKAHKIAPLSGFGEKSEQDILESIQLARQSKGRIPLTQAQEAADKIISQMKKLKFVKKIEVAGSVRRKKAFVMDLDILASSNEPEKVTDAFTKLPDVQKILGKGPTKATVVLKSGIQADIRVLKPKSWGAGLYYFTGNKNYNIAVRKIAIKKGYKLNEYGLFEKKTGKFVAGKTEEEIARKLGIKLPKPEDREV
ncbi:MAG: nucleotidyltransferase domain-containing protein [Candidatus Pacearchaeota archaeon]